MKKYLWIAGGVGLIIFLIAAYFIVQKAFVTPRVERGAVIKELRELNRLETASFTIEKIIDAKTPSNNRLQELLFGDKLLLVARGEVIAGIDMSAITEDNIQITDQSVSVTLPQPQILIVSIDNQQTQVYDRQTGLFTKGNKDLEAEARAQAQESIRVAACEGGILDEAAESAKKQLTALFHALGFVQVTISIPSGSCL